MNIYDFSVTDRNRNNVNLSDYSGKVILVVNTATGCGFTPQYRELQEIYEEYRDRGFEILDFPCNQFGNQAPGSDEEIHSFCTGRFGITFPQFAKVDVKGDSAIPLYRWIENNAPFKGFDKNPTGLMMTQMLKKEDKKFAESNSIKWNFTKILVDRKGDIIARFEPTASIKKVKEHIASVLQQ